MRVCYRVLGPVDAVDADGRPLPLGGERQRALLAALLARPGEVVSSDRLAHLLWGDDQPDNPAAALHSQVARLRQALRAGDGPRLLVMPGWVSNLEVLAAGRDPRCSLMKQLARRLEVVLYDRCGTGLSGGEADFGLDASV
jgi:hypothetical protein